MTSFVSIYSLYKRALLPESWKLQFPVRSLKLSNLGHGLHLDGGPVKCWSGCCSQKYRKNLRSGETGPPKHTYSWDHAPPSKKTKFLINYSLYRDTGRIFFLKYNQIKNVFLLTVWSQKYVLQFMNSYRTFSWIRQTYERPIRLGTSYLIIILAKTKLKVVHLEHLLILVNGLDCFLFLLFHCVAHTHRLSLIIH